MATERLIPGGPFVNETTGNEALIPGGPYLNDTTATALPTLTLPGVQDVGPTSARPKVTRTFA